MTPEEKRARKSALNQESKRRVRARMSENELALQLEKDREYAKKYRDNHREHLRLYNREYKRKQRNTVKEITI
jgi:hypothetical protein